MTRCRTGCDAEINYKRVFFSNPLDWYDIPMEGDVIHDCSKVKPFTNDPDFDVLKEAHTTVCWKTLIYPTQPSLQSKLNFF